MIYLGLGSNLGDRMANLRGAALAIARLNRIEVDRLSTLYETSPVGGPPDQGEFLNAAMSIRAPDDLDPRLLLKELLSIETAFGRIRGERWGPRTLDIDILLWDARTINTPGLQVPHPRLAERLFVLAPLAELCPELSVPGLNRTVRQLLDGRRGNRSAESVRRVRGEGWENSTT